MNPYPVPPGVDAWQPWTPAQLHQRLDGISAPWHVVGGWALDIWHGHETRPHDDLEFCILEKDLDTFRNIFSAFEIYTVHNGDVTHLAGDEKPSAGIQQFWILDTAAMKWRADLMIEPGDAHLWRYKRDLSVQRPRSIMVEVSPDGIPYLNAAGVLLFKAKRCRAKDQLDFQNALPKLAPADRTWLKETLVQQHPNHGWIGIL